MPAPSLAPWPYASATRSGVVNTSAQAFAGEKTFDSLVVTGTITTSGLVNPATTSWTFLSNVTATGGTDTAFIFDTANSLAAGDVIASFRNVGVEVAHVKGNGTGYFPEVQSTTVKANTFTQIALGSTKLSGRIADGASAVGVILDNDTALATSGAKIVSVRNATVEKAYFDKDGRLVIGSPNVNASTVEIQSSNIDAFAISNGAGSRTFSITNTGSINGTELRINSANGIYASSGILNLYSISAGSGVVITGSGAAAKPLIVRGAASQTANLQEWQNSASSAVAFVDEDGRISASGIDLPAATASTYNIAISNPSASGNPWKMKVGWAGNYDNYFKIGYGDFAESAWDLAITPGGVIDVRVGVAAPYFASQVTGIGHGQVLRWANSGPNYSGTAYVGLNYPSGDQSLYEYTSGAGTWQVRRGSDSASLMMLTAATGNLAVDTNTLYVDAVNNRVGILTTTPGDPLEVGGIIYSSSGGFRFPDGSTQTTAAAAATWADGGSFLTATEAEIYLPYASGGSARIIGITQATGGTANGNPLTIRAGQGNASGVWSSGGALIVSGGNGGAAGGYGGAATFHGGDANGSGGQGGAVTIRGGYNSLGAPTSSTGFGGSVTISGGDSGSQASGNVTIRGGNASGGTNGTVTILGGSASSGSAAGGNVTIRGGNGSTNTGGSLSLDSGTGSAGNLVNVGTSYSTGVFIGRSAITTTVAGILKSTGGRKVKITTAAITATTTLDATYHVVICNPNSADITLNLPAAASSEGLEYDIKNKSGTYTVTIDPNSTETIEDGTTLVIGGPGYANETVTIRCDGTAWHVF